MIKTLSEVRVGFIGCGMMATALMAGFEAKGVVDVARMCGSCKSQCTVDRVGKLGVPVYTENVKVVAQSDVIFLSVKPYVLPHVLEEIRDTVTKEKLVVSIAAGVTIGAMENVLPEGSRLIRVMPNTPCSVGAAASAYVKGTHATEDDMALVGELMTAVGLAIPCAEKDLNAVTGLTGSGPAYVFLMIEALADGAVRAGLPRAMALKMAAQMVKGAAQMAVETGLHPGVLKDQVCSPGGTTIAGVEALEKGNFRATVMSAVTSAKARADELSKQ
ncbi:Pyrroline-5-carboxylate reductase [Hondaea fermentalgiana]|uniref:Pyrroline-5-carboxylate reductase n=1 Tax=Hondaea fermentalgiana TaxID=2315210 RepID=A0A2R5GIB7_9STRA|nr:Pyrroline-5-carboxylate reductase [Hondaea fermentalgiana]|eukprot:GBG30335.1 Pyrroline-5-carboxylate reductase [Hondaea fermentalgiana]